VRHHIANLPKLSFLSTLTSRALFRDNSFLVTSGTAEDVAETYHDAIKRTKRIITPSYHARLQLHPFIRRLLMKIMTIYIYIYVYSFDVEVKAAGPTAK